MRMNKLTNEQIIGIVLPELSDYEINQSIIYYDTKALHPGEKVRIGKDLTTVSTYAYLVFVDLEPKANWGHKCKYFLIDPETKSTKIMNEEFPPHLGEYPESFKVILRYGKKPQHDRFFSVFD
jgi:hypothetical protein